MLLVNTNISHNERWPRKGVMFAPQFLLKSGDELMFNWVPINEEQKLKIEIESESATKEIELPSIQSMTIQDDSLVSILIENLPEYKLYGHLTVNLNSEHNKNPFPETKYTYEFITQKGTKTKKCINSIIDRKIGANTIIKSAMVKYDNPLFDTINEQFDETFQSDRFIYKQKLFRFDEGEEIHITFQRPKNKNIYVGISLERVNCRGTYGDFTEKCYFISNSTDYYILETFKYPTMPTIEEENFGEIKLYSNKQKKPKVYYEIVYNELFKKNELEPKEASI